MRSGDVWCISTAINWLITNAFIFPLAITVACSPNRSGTDVEQELLTGRAMIKDESIDSLLLISLPGLNCLAAPSVGKQLVIVSQFDPGDTTQILVTPYASFGKQY